MNYKFGDRVRFTHTLKRQCGDKDFRFWYPKPTGIQFGIIIGIRNLSNGYMTYSYDPQYWSYLTKEKNVTAYLVACDMKHKPVYVLPEHISISRKRR